MRLVASMKCDGCSSEIDGEHMAWAHRSHTVCDDCKPTTDRPCVVCGSFDASIVKARLSRAFALRLVAFDKELGEAINKVAHADDQDRLFELLDKFHDVVDPFVNQPDGGSQGLRGAVGDEYGFKADWYEVADMTSDSVCVMARLSYEVPE